MAAIGSGWADGAFVEAGWVSGAWSSGADVTAPVLTSAAGTHTGTTTASGTVSTDEGNGTLYWIVDQSATPPSVAQIQAGQDSGGAAADDSGNQAVSTTGTQAVASTGLSDATTYYFHYQQVDSSTNDSTVVTSNSFLTGAVASTRIFDERLTNDIAYRHMRHNPFTLIK